MLLTHGLRYLAESKMLLGMLFFTLFWSALVNIAGSKILSTMGKKENKATLVIVILLSLCTSFFAVFATFGALGVLSPWDFLFPAMISILAPLVFEIYFVVLSIVTKEVE